MKTTPHNFTALKIAVFGLLLFFSFFLTHKSYGMVLLNQYNGAASTTFSSLPNWYFAITSSSPFTATGTIFIKTYGDIASGPCGTYDCILTQQYSPEHGGGYGAWNACYHPAGGDFSLDGGTICELTTSSYTINTGDWIGTQVNNAVEHSYAPGNQVNFPTNNASWYNIETCIATTYAEVYVAGCGLAPPIPTVNFVFPQNGTTTIPFNWLSASFTNLTSTSVYEVTERTDYTGWFGFGGTKNIFGTPLQVTGDKFLRFGYTTGFPIIYDYTPGQYFSMISQIHMYDITGGGNEVASQTIQWNLIPYQHDGQNLTFGTTTILDNHPIWIQATSTNPVTTPWDGTNSTSTTTSTIIQGETDQFCTPASNITDIGGGIRYGACTLLLSVPQTVQDRLGADFAITKTRFPISLFFTFAGNASSSLSQGTSGPVAYNTLAFTFPALQGNPSATINLIPEPFPAGSPQEAIKNTVWELITSVLWLSTAFGFVIIMATP